MGQNQRGNGRSRQGEATAHDRQATLVVGLGMMAAAIACARVANVHWAGWQWVLVLFVAFDLGGGIASACMPPTLRSVRPQGDPLRPLHNAVLHIHPLLLALVVPGQDWTAMFLLHGAGAAGVAATGLVPTSYRASLALAWSAGAIALITSIGIVPGLAWLAPTYLLKLVGSFAVLAPWEQQS